MAAAGGVGLTLDKLIFYTLAEAEIPIEAWRRHYNTARPRSSPATDRLPR